MDLALETVGTNGKFQKVVTGIILTVASMALLSGIAFPFLTKKPDLLCREKGNELDSYHACHEDETCNNVLYDTIKNHEKSLFNMAYEYEIFCEDAYLSGLIGSSFFFGGIVGSVVFSPIPDLYGREKIYKILLFCVFATHLSFLLSTSKLMIPVINFLAGVVCYSYSMSTLIITEYLDRRYSGIIMSVNNAIFPFTGLILAFFYMFINNWRIMYAITSLMTLTSALLGYKYFLESPRWLNSKNRMNDCFETLKKIAIVNGKEDSFKKYLEANSDLVKSSNELQEVKKSYNLWEIINLKSQKKNLLLLIYIWFAGGFCFYGLILNIEHLGGDIFVDSIITFTGEIISELCSGYLADEFGRVIVLELSGAFGGIAFIIYELVSGPDWLKSALVFATSFGFSATFNLIFIYSPELFPTTIRSTVMGFLFLMSRLGALMVPAISAIIPHNAIFFGVLALLSSYCSTMLPETMGTEIPDDVPESKRRHSFLSQSSGNSNKDGRSFPSFRVSRKSIVSDFYFKVETN